MGNHDDLEVGEARWRPADGAGRLASGYKANREVLEPLARLVVDVVAIAMLLRHRQTTKEESPCQ